MTTPRSLRAVVVPGVVAVLLVLAQVAYPLTVGVGRDRVTVVVVMLSAATGLAHAVVSRGVGFAVGVLVIVAGVGLVAEIVGVATGLPFGCYEYAHGGLGVEVAGVPVVVPLAWAGGLYPVWVVAGRLSVRGWLRVSLTAVGAVGWDLFLDPQMVADGRWRWCSAWPGLPGLAQIPWTNYVGWLGVALLMAVLLEVLDRGSPRRAVTIVVPVVVFLWTWLGSTLAHAVFLGLPVSAGYGFVGLGLLGIPLVCAIFRDSSPRFRRAFGRNAA
ncbi:carotenoid biosynthesis protein [Nocardia terpenica]|uniref:Carotenoid biosynthesis protein n=1 Tax=Nocardia terpenica TaxID=455432 RepID=A0A291RIL7_9NOCA|nr:carotenoid biosynthesis protein [Nocardia terpenica]ATL66922.1 carotenoid biosynthesis protein [Nocardia terpenica]